MSEIVKLFEKIEEASSKQVHKIKMDDFMTKLGSKNGTYILIDNFTVWSSLKSFF
jgi:hypothetical protein